MFEAQRCHRCASFFRRPLVVFFFRVNETPVHGIEGIWASEVGSTLSSEQSAEAERPRRQRGARLGEGGSWRSRTESPTMAVTSIAVDSIEWGQSV